MKKKYWIILVVVLVAIAGSSWFFFLREPKVEYREHEVKKGKITLKVLSTGSVQPENRLQIKSPIGGRAESVEVKEGQKVHKGQVLAWVSSTERAAMIDSARSVGPEEVKKWEEIYRPTPIVAPLGGTIILRGIEPGQTFNTSDAILVMADRLSIKAQVDETDLAQIHLHQRAKVTLDAYIDRELESEVSQLAYEAKTVNNVTTYVVDVLPKDQIDFLRSGMTANIVFFGDTHEDIIVIPNEFIKYDSGKPKATVKSKDKNEDRELTIGITDGKRTEVLSGLTEGETILLEIKKDSKAKNNMFSAAQGANGGGRRR